MEWLRGGLDPTPTALMGGMEASTSGTTSSLSPHLGHKRGHQAKGRLLPPSERAKLELVQVMQSVCESYWPLFVVMWLGLCTCG